VNLKAADAAASPAAGAAAGSESTSVPETRNAPAANPLAIAGLALVFVGFALLGARAVARRLARAP
jgi:hypothetical protein